MAEYPPQGKKQISLRKNSVALLGEILYDKVVYHRIRENAEEIWKSKKQEKPAVKHCCKRREQVDKG